jgi:hypothetical protein
MGIKWRRKDNEKNVEEEGRKPKGNVYIKVERVKVGRARRSSEGVNISLAWKEANIIFRIGIHNFRTKTKSTGFLVTLRQMSVWISLRRTGKHTELAVLL